MSPRRDRRTGRRNQNEWDDLAATYRGMRRGQRPRKLYKDPDNKVFGGVCAGIANYLGIEPWIVRVLFVTFLILGQLFIPLVIYCILVLVLDPEPKWDDEWPDEEISETPASSAVRASPKMGLRVVGADLREVELRLRRIETYVTSPKFALDQGFSDIGDKKSPAG